VKDVIDDLDRARAQVGSRCSWLRVTHDTNIDLGAEFSVLNLSANGNGESIGTHFAWPNRRPAAIAKIVVNVFTATLRALETMGKLDVLSRP